ncbi:GNAT family N-acetyltransferase [Bordetella petrii]|uniref:GNAT family N-acetyltransferase n=1 Tax=Bordetella petrii TaxID=94624 RepID=UPI001E60AC90|nr:GNAT family N-acetyltransferase [Bordetella petrii]MCD0502768.1 GNAT family N-acetyltransferase [Bordetella petrii]
MKISLESPSQPDVLQLIDDLDAFQKPLYPAESHHGIDIHALEKSNVLFAVARDHDGHVIACGAMVLQAAYGELKRFYTKPSHRGKGVARAVLCFLETQAKDQGCPQFVLETGNLQQEAIALYGRCGYQ